VFAYNTQSNTNLPLSKEYLISIINKEIQPDGYVDDFEVEVSLIDNNNNIIMNPIFFDEIVGTSPSYVFFAQIQDPGNLVRYQLIPSISVVYIYSTKSQIEVVKYDYPSDQLFYAFGDNIFYKSTIDTTLQTYTLNLVQQTGYITRSGRQGLNYQYRHNSNNTTRIDPATTNIIDMYVVPQSYYTQYVNWIQDTTGTVSKPLQPTINALNTAYAAGTDQYKMISDSVIFNSVVFKPLFGAKADINLQAKIKVVKDPNTTASDSEVRSAVLSAMNEYFSINNWGFGDTFYFSELSAYLHAEIGDFISSVVLVPNNPNLPFGTLYEIKCAPYEIFVNGAVSTDIVVIPGLTPNQLQIS
jgi:hypothetical protein